MGISPTSVFPFFPVLIVEENVCNTLQRSCDGLVWKLTKDQWEVVSVTRWCTPWNAWAYPCRTWVEHVHHTSVSGYAQSRGDQINIQRVGCLCPVFLSLYHCRVMAWAEISERDRERLDMWCRLFLNLDPGQNAPSWCMQSVSTGHTYYLTTRLRRVHRVQCVRGTARWIMQQERLSSAAIALLWYHVPYGATAGGPRVEMMSIILLLPVAISTDRSTDWPCALDMFNTTRSFTHICNHKVGVPKFWLYSPTVLYPLPASLHNIASKYCGLYTNLKILKLLWEKMGISKFPPNTGGEV